MSLQSHIRLSMMFGAEDLPLDTDECFLCLLIEMGNGESIQC